LTAWSGPPVLSLDHFQHPPELPNFIPSGMVIAFGDEYEVTDAGNAER